MFSTYIGADVLKTIKWTAEIDKVFRDNLKNKDPTLKWQYFGSQDAVFRTYPGNNASFGELLERLSLLTGHYIPMYDIDTTM